MAEETIDISVVVPVFNERENVAEVAERVHQAMAALGRPYELLFIDDGSTDGTWEELRRIHADRPNTTAIRFRKNFGQTAALQAGFRHSRGGVIVTMDGDLQNDPKDIHRLVERLEQGYDIVSGWRRNRQDPFLNRRLPSIIANRIISFFTGVHLHDYGCTLKAFRSDVARHLKIYGEMHRFIPAIASWMGVSVDEVEVTHHPRTRGKSKYGIFRTVRVILDLITVKFLLDYSTKPIQMFGLIGLISGALGFGLSAWLAWQRLFMGISLANRPILLLAVLLILVGVQFITMGLLAELQTRIYHESSDKPTYFIKDTLA
jgi:glycosyltransferase involved in cell wall biosynthesis